MTARQQFRNLTAQARRNECVVADAEAFAALDLIDSQAAENARLTSELSSAKVAKEVILDHDEGLLGILEQREAEITRLTSGATPDMVAWAQVSAELGALREANAALEVVLADARKRLVARANERGRLIEALRGVLAAIDHENWLCLRPNVPHGDALHDDRGERVFFVDDEDGVTLLLAAKPDAIDVIEAAAALLSREGQSVSNGPTDTEPDETWDEEAIEGWRRSHYRLPGAVQETERPVVPDLLGALEASIRAVQEPER
jgi:hypothetical protein